MKRAIILFGLVVAMSAAAMGQFAGQLSGAPTVTKNQSNAIVNIGLYDDAITLVGTYRYGIGGYTDIGGHIGFADLGDGRHDEGAAILGGDLRYQVLEVRIKDPFDMSVGGSFETLIGGRADYFDLGAFLVGSYPFRLNSGRQISPYGRLLAFIRWSDSHSDFDLAFTSGGILEIGSRTSLAAELQFADFFGFLIGINFGL